MFVKLFYQKLGENRAFELTYDAFATGRIEFKSFNFCILSVNNKKANTELGITEPYNIQK